MLELGLLAFTQPWLLLAALALPALWLLLRVTPPAPRRIAFPPFLLLAGLVSPERTPARTPWWLLLLRLAIAALLILALAGPVLNPAPRLGGSGPLLLVVDNGWAAAKHWDQRDRRSPASCCSRPSARAARCCCWRPRPTPTAESSCAALTARAALEALPGWQPRPWPVDRAAAREALARPPGSSRRAAVWLSDGIALGAAGPGAPSGSAEALRQLGPLQVRAEPAADLPLVLRLGEPGAASLTAAGDRPCRPTRIERTATSSPSAPTARPLARVPVTIAPGEAAADRAVHRRCRPICATGSPGSSSARHRASPASFLLDERWRRRSVGLVGPPRSSGDQPLLAELYFIDRALRPFAEVREGPLLELLQPAAVAAGHGRHRRPRRRGARQARRLDRSGRRAAALRRPQARRQQRTIWSRSGCAPATGSWAARCPGPSRWRWRPSRPTARSPACRSRDEVRVSRQVLAEPGPDLAAATMASLSDGTPLVTGARRGKGWLILVHTTANTAWTNLPLSGPVRADAASVLALGPASAARERAPLEPSRCSTPSAASTSRSGARRHSRPTPSPRPCPARRTRPASTRRSACASAATMPTEAARSALNLQRALARARCRLARQPPAAAPEPYARAAERDLAPWLMLAALLLALVDLVDRPGPARPAARLAAGSARPRRPLLLLCWLPAAMAQEAGPTMPRSSS